MCLWLHASCVLIYGTPLDSWLTSEFSLVDWTSCDSKGKNMGLEKWTFIALRSIRLCHLTSFYIFVVIFTLAVSDSISPMAGLRRPSQSCNSRHQVVICLYGIIEFWQLFYCAECSPFMPSMYSHTHHRLTQMMATILHQRQDLRWFIKVKIL